MEQYLCLTCQHFDQSYLTEQGYDCYKWHGVWFHESIVYECGKMLKVIRKLREACPFHLPFTQTRLNIGEDGMVKTDEIPSEGARMDLNNLPEEVDLKALNESLVAASAGKSGGLQITFENRQGAKVTQKYTAISGAVLQTACRNLKIKDTKELQEAWYHYELTKMRMGYPRFIPTEKCKEQ